jgi:hypothetical protein
VDLQLNKKLKGKNYNIVLVRFPPCSVFENIYVRIESQINLISCPIAALLKLTLLLYVITKEIEPIFICIFAGSLRRRVVTGWGWRNNCWWTCYREITSVVSPDNETYDNIGQRHDCNNAFVSTALRNNTFFWS